MTPPAADARGTTRARPPSPTPDEIAVAVERLQPARSSRRCRPPPAVGPMLAAAGRRGVRLGDPLELAARATIDRYVEAAGWLPALTRDRRVASGSATIKPHPAIFAAAADGARAAGRRRAILHVGDDWAADVVGAAAAGWRAA